MENIPNKIEILLVEDNPGDVRLTKEALGGARLIKKLHVVEDGEKALNFLKRQGKYKDAGRPDLIMLDLNLPRLNGLEVLAEIKADPALRKIPVVILTTSEDEGDVIRSYDLSASSYLVKPVRFDEFIRVIDRFKAYWVSVVKYPSH